MTEKTLGQIAYESALDHLAPPNNFKLDWVSLPKWSRDRYTIVAQAVAKAVREQCADICDQHASVEGIAQKCAAAIRALNTKS